MDSKEKPKPQRFDACCSVCYTCTLASGVKKKDAERACTGHMSAYGHHVFIIPTVSR